jgi:rubrerythrin
MEYLFSKCSDRGCRQYEYLIPDWAGRRWQKQRATAYAELSESEQDSDLKEADKFLELLVAYVDEHGPGKFLEVLANIAKDQGNHRLHAKLVWANWDEYDIEAEANAFWVCKKCGTDTSPLDKHGICYACNEVQP